MDIQRLLQRYRKVWQELDGLLAQFEKEPRSIEAFHIRRLTRLYKQCSAHLAMLQSRYPEDSLTAYVNGLAARAHHMVYKYEHHSGSQLTGFMGGYFIRLVRSRKWFTIAAFALLLAGFIAGFAAVLADADNARYVLPAGMAERVDPSRTGEGLQGESHAVISAQIMTNNIRVAVLAFAAGITFGVGTVYLMVYNGLLIGGLAAIYWQAGETYLFWAYILPHGIIELTAIFIAGGAGLFMGYKMWVPGQYPWRLQLLKSAKESVQLLLGTIPLFVVAAAIEGYITPSSLSLSGKYAVAIFTLGLVAVYVLLGHKLTGQKPEAADGRLMPAPVLSAPDNG